VGALPKGRLFATTRDELIECAAVVRAIREGDLDRLEIPRNALDILAQQMVAACANEEFTEDELFAFVRRAFPYRMLTREDFDSVLETVSEGITTTRGRAGAYLHRDAVNRRVRSRRNARLTAITSGGAIPETGQYLVVAEPEGAVVGALDEDFAIESMAGDIFHLGATSWRIRRVESGRVRVDAAPGAPSTIPFWNGEGPGRTLELSVAVSRLREDIAANPSPEWIERECGVTRAAAEQAAAYVQAGRAALGALPGAECVVAERFFDEGGGMQLILHAPFGARINRAWGLALRKRFCRSFNFELQAAATDNGINISLGEQHSFPLEAVFAFLHPDTCEEVLTQALLGAPMFGARWRWNATRALAIPRFQSGRKVPPPIQRMRADDLMAAVFPDQAACPENLTGELRIPEHPFVRETISNCLHEALDLNGMREIIAAIRQGRIRTVAIDTPEPSPFCHEILNANPYSYLDDAPLEERRARAVQLRSSLRNDFAGGAGALDAAAIDQVRAEAWPSMRDADELHEALAGLFVWDVNGALGNTGPAGVEALFAQLVKDRRASTLRIAGGAYWVAAERLGCIRRVYSLGTVEPDLAAPASSRPEPEALEACAAEILRGWFECCGPVTARALADGLAIAREVVDQALAQLEAEGQILRGRFTTNDPAAEIEWCHRRLLARIHRLTLGRLRREIEPVSTAEFFAFLHRWQHLAPGGQLHGLDGTLQIVKQLQGCEFPAAAWESEVLPRRIGNYKPEYLDQLCLAGEISWGRISRHPAFERDEAGRNGRRIRPTRVAPLAIFVREDAGWILGSPQEAPKESLTEPARAILAHLETQGASFFGDLQRAGGRTAADVEDGLWELVAAGLVTADGFENLRALLDPKRRDRRSRPRHAAGRWCLLRHTSERPADATAAFAKQLLSRWGVVFRDIAVKEPNSPPWRELLIELRRMESRGEIRGGRFVSAFIGEQFARPEALDLLRAIHRDAERDETAVMSAAIPSPAALLWPPHESGLADLLHPAQPPS
jgi:ATP-dependent Lhr-like helicase